MAVVTYHNFEAERGGASLGTETDFELLARFGDHWSASVKYADHDGVPSFADRDKLWLAVDFTH